MIVHAVSLVLALAILHGGSQLNYQYKNPLMVSLSNHARSSTSPGRAKNQTLTRVAGIRVGHHTLKARPTGCTVVLVDGGAIAGIAQRGAAPGTRDTALLDVLNTAERVNAIALSGGSAYGLDVANGVMRWLDEHGIGSQAGETRVPIVASAVLIDLRVGGKPGVRPDADCGYAAASAAGNAPVKEGSVGAGAGATVGKWSGFSRAMKGGLGSAAIVLPNGLQVAALAAVNPLGDVVNPRNGEVIAGARRSDGSFADARKRLRAGEFQPLDRPDGNTTIGIVATNARLTKADANRVASMADAAYARTIVPAHTIADGDTVFSLATGEWSGAVDVSVVGALAAEALADAVVRAVTHATGVRGYPAPRTPHVARRTSLH